MNDTAMHLATEVGGQAVGQLRESWDDVKKYIQRGPEGISWLCFMGGLATFLLGVLGFIDIFDAMLDPLYYLINAYQMLFGLCTCIIELPRDFENQKLQSAQKFVYKFGKFLTTIGGRGLFYLFQGSLALSLTGVSLQFLLGCFMLFVGLLCLLEQCGFSGILFGPGGSQEDVSSRQDNGYIAIRP
mmetsp:Transcript_61107/g.176088  ORF Transcript_61107/g.176088 Transcript_61107/m.176088 type:complete len:186 (-) Transcript_61107:216-773(-)